jgi:hypothetical protein
MHNATNYIAMLNVCQPQGHGCILLKLLISLNNDLDMGVYS